MAKVRKSNERGLPLIVGAGSICVAECVERPSGLPPIIRIKREVLA